MTDVVTPDHKIKADELYRVARMAMEKSQSITIAGITFNVQDIDHIFNIIQRG